GQVAAVVDDAHHVGLGVADRNLRRVADHSAFLKRTSADCFQQVRMAQSRPEAPSLRRSFSAWTSFSKAAASWAGRSGGIRKPVMPSRTASETPPMSWATTGRPWAEASR